MLVDPYVRASGTTKPGADRGIRFSEILSPLTFALDLTEGRAMGHSVRSCILGMRIARHIGLSVQEQADLFYALLLKDAGCSANSSKLFHILTADEIRAKRDVKLTDWTSVGWDSLQYAISHVATGKPLLDRIAALLKVAARQKTTSRELVKVRCERGASIAKNLGLSTRVASAIYSLDEHWNGGGYPNGLRGQEIPMFSRILNVAQTLDVFLTCKGPQAAHDVIAQRSKRWFDPDLVLAVHSLGGSGALWRGLEGEVVLNDALGLEPAELRLQANEESINGICDAFAEIIDAKSPFTYRHSNGVAMAAVAMAKQLGLDHEEVRFVRRAALLHDVGKLGVSNQILEKPGSLDAAEWQVVRRHPLHTFEILRRIPGFAVADIYDALAARRPYRDATPLDRVFALLEKEVAAHKIDAVCVEALKTASGLCSLSSALGDSICPPAPEPGVPGSATDGEPVRERLG